MDNLGIGDLAAILAAAGVTIYVLGLIGLAIPIRRVFTDNISTAWYAVSLSPKTVVAGQGVRIWTQWLIVITALTLLGTLVLRLMAPVHLDLRLVVGFVTSVVTLSRLVVVRNIRIMRATGLLPRSYLGERRRWLEYSFYFFVAWVGGMLIAGVIFYTASAGPSPGPEGDPYFRNYILAIFAVSFLISLPTAISTVPPLPKARITQKPGDDLEGIRDPIEGWLIAHSEGFWHLFVLADEQRELLSIPDDRMRVVRILREAPRTAKETTSPEDTKSEPKQAK